MLTAMVNTILAVQDVFQVGIEGCGGWGGGCSDTRFYLTIEGLTIQH